MDLHPPQINLALAWLWILIGFLSGFILGLYFHREEWLGGYASLKRRMYRLAHISIFGLAIINLLFYFTVTSLNLAGGRIEVASWGFIIGALAMPACCLFMAHNLKLRALFPLPVASLSLAGFLTLGEVLGL
ncbi:MAG: hypothetical protein A2Z27_01945 [candidate division Zixibacteria bacterium RBG_16_50_21]|nr:MAG: hypothetical protein A2Z27_01945 [candidate division Zixibacteria bacterium RBG_16_50_21]